MLEIRTVAVIGAGPQGRRIAETAALAGFRTILVDILPSSLRQAQSEMRDRLEQARELGHLSAEAAHAALERVETAGAVADAAREADLVIEAVPDEMESKLEIFSLLDRIARPHVILASTASSLSVGEIASVTYRRPQIVGMRFRFTHSGVSGRLELLRAIETSQETLAACESAGRRMGLDLKIVAE